jgi:hypothetical protein
LRIYSAIGHPGPAIWSRIRLFPFHFMFLHISVQTCHFATRKYYNHSAMWNSVNLLAEICACY